MITNDRTVRAVLYTRVSTEGQAEQGTSLASQLEQCQRKARELGAVVVGHHVDAGVSGSEFEERPGIQASLQDIEEGRANLLICYDLSRLTREVKHMCEIRDRVADAGARLLFCMGHYSDDEEGELHMVMDGGFKQYEKRVIRRRTMQGKRKLAESGRCPTRSYHPLGYHVPTKQDILTGLYPPGTLGIYQVIESEAAIVRGIFARYAAGATLKGVAQWLHDNGIPTRQGSAWWINSTVRRILINPLYKGEPEWGKTEYRKSVRRQAPVERRVQLSAPALVDPETWDACQRRLRENRENKALSTRTARRMLLTGLIRCPVCGRGMAGRRINSRGTRAYLCEHHAPSRNPAGVVCNRKKYNAQRMEEATFRAIEDFISDPEQLSRAVEDYLRGRRQESHDDQLQTLQREREKLIARERATVEAQIAGVQAGAGVEVYVSILGEIAKQKAALTARIDRLEQESQREAKDSRRIWDTVTLARTLVENAREILHADPEDVTASEKNQVLRRIVHRVVPEGEGVDVEFDPQCGIGGALIHIHATPNGVVSVRVERSEEEGIRAA